jgi:hypothetical protein
MNGWRRYVDVQYDASVFETDPLTEYPALITHGATMPPATRQEFFERATVQDLRATLLNGVQIPLHAVAIDPIAETCQLWPQIPLATGPTVIRLWFDNPNADPVPVDDPHGQYAVWGGHALAMGLEEQGNGTAGEYRDWTANGNHGQGGGGNVVNTPTRVDGVVGSGQSLDVDWIGFPAWPLSGLSAGTLSIWLRYTSTAAMVAANSSLASTGPSYGVYSTSGTLVGDARIGGVRHTLSAGVLNDGQWHLATLAYDGTTVRFRVDNSAEVTSAATGTIDALSHWLGRWHTADTLFHWLGSLDHYTLAATARPLAWHRADYRLQGTQSLVQFGEIQRARRHFWVPQMTHVGIGR